MKERALVYIIIVKYPYFIFQRFLGRLALERVTHTGLAPNSTLVLSLVMAGVEAKRFSPATAYK